MIHISPAISSSININEELKFEFNINTIKNPNQRLKTKKYHDIQKPEIVNH